MLTYNRYSATEDRTIHKLTNLDKNISLAIKPTRFANIIST